MTVEVSGCGIDYPRFFQQMTNLIQSNINIEGFVDSIRSDFSTSTPTHKIVSEIMMMSSMQEYFDYTMCVLCGIPYIEFMGTAQDWEKLKAKLLKLKELLKPIQKEIGLVEWWDEITIVCDKINQSIQGNVDVEWWTNILRITHSQSFGSGGGRSNYDGWFITKVLNQKHGVSSLSKLPSGLVSIPLKIDNNGAISEAAIVSGIAGMKIDDSKDVPVVESTHGWAMFQ